MFLSLSQKSRTSTHANVNNLPIPSHPIPSHPIPPYPIPRAHSSAHTSPSPSPLDSPPSSAPTRAARLSRSASLTTGRSWSRTRSAKGLSRTRLCSRSESARALRRRRRSSPTLRTSFKGYGDEVQELAGGEMQKREWHEWREREWSEKDGPPVQAPVSEKRTHARTHAQRTHKTSNSFPFRPSEYKCSATSAIVAGWSVQVGWERIHPSSCVPRV